MRIIGFVIGVLSLGLSLACASVSLSGPQRVAGSGQVGSVTRDASGATRVNLAGFGDVRVVRGPEASVVVETDDNLLSYVETPVQNGTLVLRSRRGVSLDPTEGIRFTVTLPDLTGLMISGSGNIEAAAAAGSDLEIDLTGSGNIVLTGVADTIDIALSGSGNVLCGDLEATAADVVLRGSGEITVWATSRLEAALPGSGTIRYYGEPDQVSTRVPGSGSIVSLGPKE